MRFSLRPHLETSNSLVSRVSQFQRIALFHIVRPQDKPQSKPQILSIQRYPPNRNAISEFTQLQDKLHNPLFRQQYWQNLVRDRPRIEGFYTLLRDLPYCRNR